jgi:hypothetical protein
MKRDHDKLCLIALCAGLVLTILISFEQVRHNEFVYEDVFVTNNPKVTGGISRESLAWAFTSTETSNWFPLTWLSHIVDCQMFGLNPCGHHMVNLLFHIANTLLLFWLLRRMTGRTWPSAFVAAVFSLHPLRVESVAWVAERKDVLSGFFFMLTLVAYIRFVARPSIARYVVVALVFALGLMSKPMLVTLPFVLLLLDYWPLGRFQQASGEAVQVPAFRKSAKSACQRSSVWHLIIEKIPLFALSATAGAIAFVAQRGAGAMKPGAILSLDFRISNAIVSYILYIGKIFYPRNLAVLYLHPRLGWPRWQVAVCLVMLVVLSVVAICSTRKRYLALGWFWYVGTLVPVIGLVQVGTQAMADRYTYLPSIGINIIVAWSIADIFAKLRYREFWLGMSAGLLVITLSVCTRIQVRYWQNELSLFGHAAEVTENNYVMHANYGIALRKNGQFKEAIRHSGKALQISSKNYRPLENVALSYYMLGKVEQAISHWYKALEIDPDWLSPLNSLAWALATTNDDKLRNPTEAVRFAERACELTKYRNAGVLDTLAAAYAAAGRFGRAVETAEKAVERAIANGSTGLARKIQSRLRLYKTNQPYYEGSIDNVEHRAGD